MIWFSSFFKTTSGIIINNAIGFNWETIIQNNTIKKKKKKNILSNTRVELIIKAFSATQASVSVNMVGTENEMFDVREITSAHIK